MTPMVSYSFTLFFNFFVKLEKDFLMEYEVFRLPIKTQVIGFEFDAQKNNKSRITFLVHPYKQLHISIVTSSQ